ncbi:site-2 protease family protein [Candidatus Woesearchaeota archaeon]|nr:site-2 protease family protein [Candidatus Woesearchaeota archaeon]
MTIQTILQDYKWVILFYSTIILLVFIFRKKFDIHSKFLAMYRTKIGIKLMDKIGVKYAEPVKLLGYIGIGVGYVGLVAIVYMLLMNLYNLLTIPEATSAVSLVIPGIRMPGSPIVIPLITGWIALFIVILVHEFSHGVVARAHKLKVKSSGIFFLGPLMGAFVEPSEKHLRKSSDTVQYSIYAAGPFSNILLALICIPLLLYVFTPVIGVMEDDIGVKLVGITEGYPAEKAGLQSDMIITNINGKDITNFQEFVTELNEVSANETVILKADGSQYSLDTVSDPKNPKQGFIGVLASNKPATRLTNDAIYFKVIAAVINWFAGLIGIIVVLSLGIGLANLLPLGPVDGGRMLQVSLEKIKGKVRGNVMWRNVSIATLFILLINIFWPLIKSISNLIF